MDSENSNTVLSNKNYRKTAPKITQFNRSIKLLNRLESSRGSFDALNKVKQRCITTIVFVGLSGLWHILKIWKFHLLKKKLAIGKKKKDFHLPCTKKNLASLKSPPPPIIFLMMHPLYNTLVTWAWDVCVVTSCYLTPQRKGLKTLDCCRATSGSRPYSWAIWVFSFRFDGSINLWLQRCAVSGLLKQLLSCRAYSSLRSNPPYCLALT